MVSLKSVCFCLKVRMPPSYQEASLCVPILGIWSVATKKYYYKIPGQVDKAKARVLQKRSAVDARNAEKEAAGDAKRRKSNKGTKRAECLP